MRCDLERSGAGDERLVLERVLDGPKAIANGVGDLRDGVGVGTCAWR